MTEQIVTELLEQPDAVARATDAARASLAPWVEELDGRQTIVFLARGSSDNAARYGGYLLAVRNGHLTSLALPSVTTRYRRDDVLDRRTAVVAISQSGRSPDLVATLRAARQHGSVTLAITNSPASPLADVAACTFDLHCGPERAVAATKSYTASLAALAELSRQLHGRRDEEGGPEVVVTALREAVAAGTRPAAVELLQNRQRCVVVGRGFQLATAHEAALKIQELTGIMAQPFSPADLEHGPIAALGPDVPVILIATHGPMAQPTTTVIDQARHRGSPIIVVSDVPDLLDRADAPIPVPRSVPEWLAPITTIVSLQWLAIDTARAIGADIDHPHGLRKITETH